METLRLDRKLKQKINSVAGCFVTNAQRIRKTSLLAVTNMNFHSFSLIESIYCQLLNLVFLRTLGPYRVLNTNKMRFFLIRMVTEV